ncbi:MAG: hypothetical protein ACI9JY_002868, partial [Saprospiraceae bacterium]
MLFVWQFLLKYFQKRLPMFQKIILFSSLILLLVACGSETT